MILMVVVKQQSNVLDIILKCLTICLINVFNQNLFPKPKNFALNISSIFPKLYWFVLNKQQGRLARKPDAKQ